MFTVILAAHITGGTAALISGIVAMLTLKGSRLHRLSGRIYFWGMTVVCASSFYMAIAHPNLFLFAVGVFSYQMVAIGYRTLWLKELHTGSVKPKLVDWSIGIGAGLFNIVLLAWGVYVITNGSWFGITALVFGGIGLVNSFNWLRQFFMLPLDKRQWLYGHFQAMCGGYIATATAFLVVNLQFLPSLFVWIAPTVIGSVLIALTTAKYKRKYAKLDAAKATAKLLL